MEIVKLFFLKNQILENITEIFSLKIRCYIKIFLYVENSGCPANHDMYNCQVWKGETKSIDEIVKLLYNNIIASNTNFL